MEESTNNISLSSKLPRLTIQLKNLLTILSDESATKIFQEINKKIHTTDLYDLSASLQNRLKTEIDQPNLLEEASELLDGILSFRKELKETKKIDKVRFYTKNLNDTINQFLKSLKKQLKNPRFLHLADKFDFGSIQSDLETLFSKFQAQTDIKIKNGKNSLTSQMVSQMIDSFKEYEDYQKSVLNRFYSSGFNLDGDSISDISLPWTDQQLRFKNFLETALHQLLFISEFKEKLVELENHLKDLIDHKNEILDKDFGQKKKVAKFIFAKKKPFFDQPPQDVSIQNAVEIPDYQASPQEAKMMEERISAFSRVVQQSKLCPKPYDRIAELKVENQRLNEVFNDGWVTSQQYEKLMEQNKQLKESISFLQLKIDEIKQKIEKAKGRRKMKDD